MYLSINVCYELESILILVDLLFQNFNGSKLWNPLFDSLIHLPLDKQISFMYIVMNSPNDDAPDLGLLFDSPPTPPSEAESDDQKYKN